MKQRQNKNVFIAFLDELKVKYTSSFSSQYFNDHPHKHNIWGLSNMLSKYQIENVVIKIQNKENGILDLEEPLITHIGSDFIVVTKISSHEVQYLLNGKKTSLPFNDFCKIWTGVTLIAETNNESKEPNYENNVFEERILFLKKATLLFLSTLLLLITSFNQSVVYKNINFKILLIFNLIGVFIAYLLIQKQMKIQSNYADKICSSLRESNCDHILESKAAKLFGIVSWSEIGLGYFITNTIILFFYPYLNNYLALINMFTLPYTVWSIWYQKFKAKQWCPLCLIIQGLLWIIFIINLASSFISFPLWDFSHVSIIICLYFIPIIVLNLLISIFNRFKNTDQIRYELNSLKSTNEVLIALLKKQPHYTVNKETSKILFGNPQANILITVLTNLHCNPCAKMHKHIENLLDENNNLCIQYIFSSSEEDPNSSSHLLISAYMDNPKQRKEIFSSWFKNGKYQKDAFFKSYNSDIMNSSVSMEYNKHKNWIEENSLFITPTILINGYLLPDNYKIEDLKYFTDLVIDTK